MTRDQIIELMADTVLMPEGLNYTVEQPSYEFTWASPEARQWWINCFNRALARADLHGWRLMSELNR